jgi:bifunctional non-homologous end joining protein LigD
MVEVSNADRLVFPEIGRTKGDVVAYYERIATRLLVHVAERPLSIQRFPKGLGAPGFFQKNVPSHYPQSITRSAVPRSRAATRKHARQDGKQQPVTIYPLVREPAHLAYLANQGALEFHVPTARAHDAFHPDRIVVDLDPPSGAFALVRRAAYLVRDALAEFGLPSVPLATGSKGYHLITAIEPTLGAETVALTLQKFAALVAAKHPTELTTVYRVAQRGERVFIDWLRNNPMASVVAPFSLRARPRATVAAPLAWDELATTDPDGYSIADVERLLDRPDSIANAAESACDATRFVSSVDDAFEASGVELETFDRFRS